MSDAPAGLDEFIASKPSVAPSIGESPAGLDEFIKPATDKRKYGSGVLNPIKAAGLGALRGATLHGSDYLLKKSGLMNEEDIKGYEEQNPVASGIGEGAAIIGSVVAAPEAIALRGAATALDAANLTGDVLKIAEATKAFDTAKAASKAFQTTDLLNPVNAISKVGNKAAAMASEFIPAGSKVLNAVGAAASMGLGSAIEGGLYNLGTSVNEGALGDPNLNAEKILSNMGYAALIGGGLGAGLGLIGSAFKGFKADKFISDTDKALINNGDTETIIKHAGEVKDKEGFLKGLGKLKSNSKEIVEAAEDIGAPVLPGNISSSEAVQKGQSALLEGPPTYFSIKNQQMAAEGFAKAQGALEETLGAESDHTKFSLGEALQESLTKKIQEQVAPINAIYEEIKPYYQSIPLSEKSAPAIARNIMDLEEARLSPSSPSAKIASRVADEIGNLKTVEDVKKYKTILNNDISSLASPGEKRIASIISDKLSDLEENSIVRFAKDKAMRDSVGLNKNQILSLLDQREAANTGYAIFKDKMSQLGDVLGKKKIHGAQDMINFISDLTPEKLGEKLFSKNNYKFLEFFSKEFPEEMNLISQYRKSAIKEAAFKDGELNIKSALKEINKLQPEVKGLLFNEQQLGKLDSIKTYIDSFPPNFNPSNTSNAAAFRAFFESPTGAAIGNARDFAIDRFIKHAISGAGDDITMKAANLGAIERYAQKTSSKIKSGIDSIFKEGSTIAGYTGSALATQENEKDYKKVAEHINNFSNNPELAISQLESGIKDIHEIAPNLTNMLMMNTSNTISFLKEKLPKHADQSLFSTEYKIPKSELNNFGQYLHIVQKPTAALYQIKNGTLTNKTIETLQRVYPSLYNEMKSNMTEKLIDLHQKDMLKNVPYKTRLSMSQFMGQDLDASLKQPSIMANQLAQARIQLKADAQKEALTNNNVKPTSKGIGNITLSDRLNTDTQTMAQRKMS